MANNSSHPKLPSYIPPMLARPGGPFDSQDYVFEIKWDGTRTMVYVEEGSYRLVNRRRIDMTQRYPEFAFLATLPPGTVLDGEMVVLKDGKPDFSLLQSRDHARSAFKIPNLAQIYPATLMVFDLLYENCLSVMTLPFFERRRKLIELVKSFGGPRLILSQEVAREGKALFRAACEQGLEGIVAKRLNSTYAPDKRTDAWVKIKREATYYCAIVGFIPSGKDDFRSLILGGEQAGGLSYVGKVGTGFDMAMRDKLNGLLRSRLRRKPIFPCRLKGKWIEPGLYCTVKCMEKTAGGHLRAPVFKDLVEEYR